MLFWDPGLLNLGFVPKPARLLTSAYHGPDRDASLEGRNNRCQQLVTYECPGPQMPAGQYAG